VIMWNLTNAVVEIHGNPLQIQQIPLQEVQMRLKIAIPGLKIDLCTKIALLQSSACR